MARLSIKIIRFGIKNKSVRTRFYNQLNLLKIHAFMFKQCNFSRDTGLTSVSKKEHQENGLYVTRDKMRKETRINRKPAERGVSSSLYPEGLKVLQQFHKWQPHSSTQQPSLGQNLKSSLPGAPHLSVGKQTVTQSATGI